jgi:hypothetical protein
MKVRFFARTASVLTARLLTACATTHGAVPDPIPVIGAQLIGRDGALTHKMGEMPMVCRWWFSIVTRAPMSGGSSRAAKRIRVLESVPKLSVAPYEIKPIAIHLLRFHE